MMLTIRPHLRARISGSTLWAKRAYPNSLSETEYCHFSKSTRSMPSSGVDPGVVDEDVDAAERGAGGGDHLGDAVGARAVARHGYDLAVGRRADLVRCLPQTIGIARHEGDVAALARQLLGDRAADTQACAGDERALAVKMQVHVNSP